MGLKGISSFLVFFLVLFPTQESGSQETPNPTPIGSEDVSVRDDRSVRLEIPLGPECPSPDFAFVVEKPKKEGIPLQLAGVCSQKRDNVTVRRGNPGSTVMSMRKWNDVLFAEMLARAVLGSIVSESELDDAAHLALRRARGTVSMNELRSKMGMGSTQTKE